MGDIRTGHVGVGELTALVVDTFFEQRGAKARLPSSLFALLSNLPKESRWNRKTREIRERGGTRGRGHRPGRHPYVSKVLLFRVSRMFGGLNCCFQVECCGAAGRLGGCEP